MLTRLLRHRIKQLKLNIPWLDLLRKTTRGEVLAELKSKLEPKPQKYIVSGRIKITTRSKFLGKNGATERITTSEEKCNETVTATTSSCGSALNSTPPHPVIRKKRRRRDTEIS